ncbi:hypothetical protein [Pseudoxanthomonas japonensis]|uniref:hypothetical protein n=1 Tax=Pseudoxanthomonas japonensis TaxID=69284 RepID=UPI003748CB63
MNALKKLFQSKTTTSNEFATAMADVELQLARSKADLEALLETYGDRVATASSPADLQKVEDEIAQARRLLERNEHLRASIQRQLDAAQASEQAAHTAAQWVACEEALTARDAAISRVQSLAQKLAQAILEADSKAADAWLAVPDVVKGKHWNTQVAAFTANTQAVLLEMEIAVGPEDPTLVRKTLHERALESTSELLALRNPTKLAA